MVLYQLPKLSYEYDELEPFFDAETSKFSLLKLTLKDEILSNSILPLDKILTLSELTSIPESGRSAINFY